MPPRRALGDPAAKPVRRTARMSTGGKSPKKILSSPAATAAPAMVAEATSESPIEWETTPPPEIADDHSRLQLSSKRPLESPSTSDTLEETGTENQ
ncbi:hypothetical protein C8J57DRAFT_1523026 [Mycena rebaudengoi]|nr:hypothetical protein C8J57DRAFT_1523026 [Mycena rebaudengoi]